MADKNQILDLYFMDARSKLIDLAAFFDRIERHEGEADFRLAALEEALKVMQFPGDKPRAQAVLESLSDQTTLPVDQAPYQGAIGANPPKA